MFLKMQSISAHHVRAACSALRLTRLDEKTGRNISMTTCQLPYKYTSAWPLCVAVYIIYSQYIRNVYVLMY